MKASEPKISYFRWCSCIVAGQQGRNRSDRGTQAPKIFPFQFCLFGFFFCFTVVVLFVCVLFGIFFVFPLLLCFLGTREKQVGQPWAPEYIFLPRNLYIELLPPNIFLIFNDLCIGFFFSAPIAGARFADKTGNSCLSRCKCPKSPMLQIWFMKLFAIICIASEL